MRLALRTSFFLAVNRTCSIKAANSKVAGITLKSPALLVVILHDEVSSKALNAEINGLLGAVIFGGNFVAHKEISVGFRIMCDAHNSEQLLHGADAEFKVIELKFEDSTNVSYNLIKVSFSFGNHFAALFNISSHLRKNQLGIDLTVSFDESRAKGCGH